MNSTIRKNIYKWQLQLDRKSLRERIIFFMLAIGIVFMLWDLILYQNAMQKLNKLTQEISENDKQTTKYINEHNTIEAAAAVPANQHLIQRYNELLKTIMSIDKKIYTYKFHTVSEEQMSAMLQSVLKDVSGVTISKLKTVDNVPNQKFNSGTASTAAVNANIQKLPFKTVAKFYQFRITGNYFAIQSYLDRLEHLDWQIYWDDFTYNVDKFPIANLTIRFHTLSMGIANAK